MCKYILQIHTWHIYRSTCLKIYDVKITIGDRILVFVEHLIEGVVELPGDGVDLQLLPDDLVLQLVNPEIVGMMVVTGDAGLDLW